MDISPAKIVETETEVIGLVERLKSRDFFLSRLAADSICCLRKWQLDRAVAGSVVSRSLRMGPVRR